MISAGTPVRKRKRQKLVRNFNVKRSKHEERRLSLNFPPPSTTPVPSPVRSESVILHAPITSTQGSSQEAKFESKSCVLVSPTDVASRKAATPILQQPPKRVNVTNLNSERSQDEITSAEVKSNEDQGSHDVKEVSDSVENPSKESESQDVRKQEDGTTKCGSNTTAGNCSSEKVAEIKEATEESDEDNFFKTTKKERRKIIVDEEEESDSDYCYPCCKIMGAGGRSIECSKCKQWWHLRCLISSFRFSSERLEALTKSEDEDFFCPSCAAPKKRAPPPRKGAKPWIPPNQRKEPKPWVPSKEAKPVYPKSSSSKRRARSSVRNRQNTPVRAMAWLPEIRKRCLVNLDKPDNYYRDENEEKPVVVSTLNSDFQSGRWVLTSQTPFPVELWQPVNGKEDCPRWIARNNFGSFVLQVDGDCVVLKDFATIWGELERHLPFANDSHSEVEKAIFLVCLLYELNPRFTRVLIEGQIAPNFEIKHRQTLYCVMHWVYGEKLIIIEPHFAEMTELEKSKFKKKKRKLESDSEEEMMDDESTLTRKILPTRGKRRKITPKKFTPKRSKLKKRRTLNDSDDESDGKVEEKKEEVVEEKPKQKKMTDFFSARPKIPKKHAHK